MLTEPTVLALSLAYLGLLFAVAYFGDRYARDWSASSVAPAVYGLSLAIYCTSWTFYGAVGRAATSGIDFILIYTGPALVVVAGYPMLRKMVRAAKQHNVTSIADFLASRYGKSRAVGVTATLFATVGVLPYIALQLQAVSSTFRTIAAPTPVAGSRAGRGAHRHLADRRRPDGGVHHPVRRAQRAGLRAASRHDAGDRLRIGGQAAGAADRRPVRAVRAVRRPGRPAGPGRRACRPSPTACFARGLAAHLGGDHAALGHGLPLPAAPVPCRGGRARPSGEPAGPRAGCSRSTSC